MDNSQIIQPNIPQEPKKSWLSKHMLLGIVFLFAIIAAAISCIYYWQTVSQIPSSVQFPVHKDVTANWKTYTNTKYGFEFKYPDYLLLDDLDYKNLESIEKRGINPNDISDLYLVINLSFPENGEHYEFLVEKAIYDNIDQWFNAWRREIETPSMYEEAAEIKNEVISTQNLDIQGIRAKKILLSGSFPLSNAYFGLIYNEKLYTFSYDGWLRESERETVDAISEYEAQDKQTKKFQEYHRNIFNQVLSTFKFTQ